MRKNVNELQDPLSRAAKQSLDRKFGALYDKIYRSDVLWEAWKRVKKNNGAPGIDGQTLEYIELVIGGGRSWWNFSRDCVPGTMSRKRSCVTGYQNPVQPTNGRLGYLLSKTGWPKQRPNWCWNPSSRRIF